MCYAKLLPDIVNNCICAVGIRSSILNIANGKQD